MTPKTALVATFLGVALLGGAIQGLEPVLAAAGVGPAAPAKAPAAAAVATTAEAANSARITSFRRLTEGEYRNSIADIFGPQIEVQGRFEPEVRVGGLLAASTSTLSITPSGFASYAKIAESISQQVVTPNNRARLAPCTPKSATAPDDKCASAMLSHYGLLAFRRPMTAEELTARVTFARTVSTSSKDFYAGVQYGLASILSSPAFLFRTEMAVPDGKGYTLDGYSRATRLSYLLWGTTPDEALLNAAADGELATDAGVAKQVDRLMASPRLESGVRAFFTDFLAPDYYGSVTKDPKIYPKWNDAIADAAREETLRTIVDVSLTQNGDFRDILTTRKTFVNRPLAAIYGVPFNFDAEWQPYEFAPESGRSGVLTQLSVLSMFSHPGRSSPTERGKAVLDIFMCSPTPPPPPDVDFSLVSDVNNPTLRSVRERLTAHATVPSCHSCHSHMDPVGLSLENFDSSGQYRDNENGEKIDASANLDGKDFVGAGGLSKILHEEPRFPTCVARKVYAYGVGTNPLRVRTADFKPSLDAFAASGYRLRPLLKSIATSATFFAAAAPAAPAATTQPAAAKPAPVAAKPTIAATATPKTAAQTGAATPIKE